MKALLKHGGIIALYALLTCLLLWPLPLHLTTGLLAAESGDPLMQIWVVQWNIQKLSTSLSHYFDANIFFPYRNTFAFHDHMFGLGVLGWPAQALSRNPVLTYNLLLLLAFVVSAYGMYWLAREVCHSEYAAWIAGLVFGFLPYRFAHLDHLNLLSTQWIPFCLVFLTRVLFSRAGTLGRARLVRNLLALAGFWGFFLLQALTSFNYLFMLAITIGIYLLGVLIGQLIAYRRILISLRMLIFFGLGGCLVVLVLLPFALPYLRANREMGFERTLDEARALSAQPQNYLAAPGDNWLYGRLTRRFRSTTSPFPREQILFPGLIALVLALGGILGRPKKFTRGCPQRSHAYMLLGSGNRLKNFTIIKAAFLVLGAAAVLLSFGPSITLGGQHLALPYAWLYRYVPGFTALRVPARFGLLAAFALSLLAAIGVAYIHILWMCRKGKRHALSYAGATILLSAVIVLEYGSLPKRITPYPATFEEIPAVYQWLAEQPDPVRILELPVRSPRDDFEYTYYSTFHWKPMVNGRSAFIPEGIAQVFGMLRDFPAPPSVDLLKSLGVDYLLLHTEKFTQPLKQIVPEEVQTVAAFDETLVLQLPPAPAVPEQPWLHVEYHLPDELPPADAYRLGVTLQSTAQSPVSPLPQERLPVHLAWQRAGHTVSEVTPALRLPILFRHAVPVEQPLVVETPEQPGNYDLRIRIDSALVVPSALSMRTNIRIAEEVRDSRRPGQLQAEFLKIEHPATGPAGQPFPVRVGVRNTGDTIWKAHVADRQQPAGEVHLGVVAWREALSGDPLEDQGLLQVSRGFLPYDIAPGQEVRIRVDLRTPEHPGHYLVELNLVSELIQWFPQAPLQIPLTLE